MADFYVKFGSKKAKLIGSYRLGLTNIKLYEISNYHYVISQNRKIIHESFDLEKAISGFNFLISSDSNNLFNLLNH